MGEGEGEAVGDAVGEGDAAGEAGMLVENHFSANRFSSPFAFILSKTPLNSATRGDPFGNAIALPDGPSDGITLYSRSAFACANPLTTVSSIIAASIRFALIS